MRGVRMVLAGTVFAAMAMATPQVLAAVTGAAPALVADPAAMVDPFIGTAGGFNTFPGPDMPFGMIQWSPETQNRHDGGGYDHGDANFRGFALTHMSGPGCPGYGDIPILPLTGGVPSGDPGSLLVPINHGSEQASPGYYSVMHGNGAQVRTELTSTMRKFRKLFADAGCYVAAIPVYVGGHMAMGIASDNKRARRHSVTSIAQRYRKAGSFKTRYWTPEVHVAAFAQPRFIADLVAKAER